MFKKFLFTVPLILMLFISSAWGQTDQLNLNQCLEIAYQKNQILLQLDEQINSAKYKIDEARSGFLPQLSLSGSYTRLGNVPAYEFGGISFGDIQIPSSKIEMGTANNYNLRLSLEQPLFTWGRIQNSYDISKYGLSSTREQYRKARQEIKYNVTVLFYRVLLAQELIKVREGSITRIEDHLRTVQDRYDKGYASEFEVLRARVQLTNARPSLVQAKNLHQLTLDNLKNLLGIDLIDKVNLEGDLTAETYEVNQSEAEEFAFQNRSELKLVKEQNMIGQKALALAKAGNKPSLFGAVNYEYKKPYYSEDKWKTDWNFTIALSLPIFDGYLTKARVNGAKSDLRRLEITESQTKDMIRLEISQAISELNLARENIISQEENVKEAKESLRIANVQYQKGMLTNLELMDTEYALTVAETNHLQALSDFLTAKAKYEKAIGKD